MKYKQAYDGDWIAPKRREYRLVCCDCGLVHRINFRLVPHHTRRTHKQIQFQPFRDERATAQIRRRGTHKMVKRGDLD